MIPDVIVMVCSYEAPGVAAAEDQLKLTRSVPRQRNTQKHPFIGKQTLPMRCVRASLSAVDGVCSSGVRRNGERHFTWAVSVTLVLLCGSIVGANADDTERGTGTQQPDVVSAFHEWFVSRGGKAPAVEVRRIPPSESVADMPTTDSFGVFATGDLADGDVVLSVPLDSVVIWRGSIERQANPREARLYRRIEMDEHAIVVFILHEMALGRDSHWAPYLRLLPESIPVPWLFTESELDALQSESDAEYAKSLRREVIAAHSKLHGTIRAVLKDRRIPKARAASFAALDKFMWATALVGSRALTLRGERFLVPFADVCNYAADSVFREASAGAHFERYHKIDEDSGSFYVFADRSVHSGGEVLEDYGDSSNHVYLHHHGFVPDNNPFDCVEMTLPALEAAPPDVAPLASRRALLRSLRMQTVSSACFNTRGIPAEAREYLMLVSLTHDRVARCRSALRHATDSDFVNIRERCLDGAMPNYNYAWFAEKARDKLDRYPTTPEEDEWLLRVAAASANAANRSRAAGLFELRLTENERVAIKFRLSRKILLREIGSFFDHMGVTSQDGLQLAEAGQLASSGGVDATAAQRRRAVGRFNDWLKSGGPNGSPLLRGRSLKLALDESSVGEVEKPAVVVAGEPLRKGDIFGVSAEAVIEWSSAVNQYPLIVPGVWKAVQRSFPCTSQGSADCGTSFLAREHAMVLHLVAARFAPEHDSPWAPFVAILPQSPSISRLLPERDTPPRTQFSLGSGIEGTIAVIRRQYEHLRAIVILPFRETLDEASFSFDNYLWALGTLEDRATWCGRERCLIPLLDAVVAATMNPGHDASIFTRGAQRASLAFKDGWITVSMWADVMAGEQLGGLPSKGHAPSLSTAQPRQSSHPSNSQQGLHYCVALTLQLCPTTEDFVVQTVRLWSWGIYQTSLSACVTSCSFDVASSGSGHDSSSCTNGTGDVTAGTACPESNLPERVVRFVRATTELTSDTAAILCMRKLVGAILASQVDTACSSSAEQCEATRERDISVLRAISGRSTASGLPSERRESERNLCGTAGYALHNASSGDDCGVCVNCEELDGGADDVAFV